MFIKYFTKTLFTFTLLLLQIISADAQQTESATTTLLKDKEYTFIAQSYSSTTVSMRQITGYYSVQVKKDSVIGVLPYFGQSYNPQINVSDGGITFASAKFDYSLVEKKKGKCVITIRPKDDRNVQLMYLTVYSDSGAELQVSSTNKEPMTFYGYVGVK